MFMVVSDTDQTPVRVTVFLRLEDSTRNVFSSTDLTPIVPLPSFDLRRFELQQTLSNGTTHRFLTGSIRTFTRIGKDIAIEIRPRNLSNGIDPNSDQTLSVAILTTNDGDSTGTFDATRVNPMSVQFGGLGRTIFAIRSLEKDVDRDGDTDLLLRFRIRDIGLNCNDTSATLRGETFSGRVVQGVASIVVIGCGTTL
jgi:hypothetical protein